jgi:hypothetical protein
VRELRSLVEALDREETAGHVVDVVTGYKISRNDPWHRRFISSVYNQSMRAVFGFKVRDVDCDFRLMKRHVLDRISLTQNSGVIALELMTKVQRDSFRTLEVPVHHFHRAYGVSQFFRVGRLSRVLIGLGKMWWWVHVQHKDGEADALPLPLRAGGNAASDDAIARRTSKLRQ